MILCLCGHYRSDHKIYYGTRGDGDSFCSVPECECEDYMREGMKKHKSKKPGYMPLIRLKRSDVDKSLNRKFGKEKK